MEKNVPVATAVPVPFSGNVVHLFLQQRHLRYPKPVFQRKDPIVAVNPGICRTGSVHPKVCLPMDLF